jgi:DNA-binding XRE family transcriptional regulator
MNPQAELIRFGETFRQIRERESVSVADLAARTGIDADQINALEAGRLDPAFDVMIALADGIGVRLSALIPEDCDGTACRAAVAPVYAATRSRFSARALKCRPSSSSPTRITKISLPSTPRGPRSSTMTPLQLKAGSFEVTWSPTFSEPAEDVPLRAMMLKVSPRTGKSERLAAVGCDLIE